MNEELKKNVQISLDKIIENELQAGPGRRPPREPLLEGPGPRLRPRHDLLRPRPLCPRIGRRELGDRGGREADGGAGR